MPEISRFLGIVILMYANEHNPPHLHVRYNDFAAVIDLNTRSCEMVNCQQG